MDGGCAELLAIEVGPQTPDDKHASGRKGGHRKVVAHECLGEEVAGARMPNIRSAERAENGDKKKAPQNRIEAAAYEWNLEAERRDAV